MTVGKILAQHLADAICRHSPMIADSIGLSLTGAELQAIYEVVGRHYIKHRMTDAFVPSAADVLALADLMATDEEAE